MKPNSETDVKIITMIIDESNNYRLLMNLTIINFKAHESNKMNLTIIDY